MCQKCYSRKRPCRICGKWFIPNPRLGDRQKTCGDPECQRQWHAKKCFEWNRKNRSIFQENYLNRKLESLNTVPSEPPLSAAVLLLHSRLLSAAFHRLYPELSVVVRHERVPTGARLTLDGTGIHRLKTNRYGLESVQSQFLELGEHAEDFLKGVKNGHPKNAGFHARYILHLKERYHY